MDSPQLGSEGTPSCCSTRLGETDMGGPGASITPKGKHRRHAQNMSVPERPEAGRYLDYSGAELPW